MLYISCLFIPLNHLPLRMDHAILHDILMYLSVLKAMQYYLVRCALQCHVWQTIQFVVMLTQVDMHLGQSEICLFIDYIVTSFILLLYFCEMYKI